MNRHALLALTLLILTTPCGTALAAAVYGFGEDNQGRFRVQSVDYSNDDAQQRAEKQRREAENQERARQQRCDRYAQSLTRLRSEGVAGAHILQGDLKSYADEARRRAIRRASRQLDKACGS